MNEIFFNTGEYFALLQKHDQKLKLYSQRCSDGRVFQGTSH